MEQLITLTDAATLTAVMSAAKSAKELITKMFGPTADAWGQILASPFQQRLLNNQVGGIEKVDKICNDEKVEIKQPSLKVLSSYLSGVALEENETLQDMWANLFVNYIDASKHLTETVYPKILADLSTRGAEILLEMNLNDKVLIIDKNKSIEYNMLNQITENLPGLTRLGLIVKIPTRDTTKIPQGTTVNSNELINFSINDSVVSTFKMTDFGTNFLNACSR